MVRSLARNGSAEVFVPTLRNPGSGVRTSLVDCSVRGVQVSWTSGRSGSVFVSI